MSSSDKLAFQIDRRKFKRYRYFAALEAMVRLGWQEREEYTSKYPDGLVDATSWMPTVLTLRQRNRFFRKLRQHEYAESLLGPRCEESGSVWVEQFQELLNIDIIAMKRVIELIRSDHDPSQNDIELSLSLEEMICQSDAGTSKTELPESVVLVTLTKGERALVNALSDSECGMTYVELMGLEVFDDYATTLPNLRNIVKRIRDKFIAKQSRWEIHLAVKSGPLVLRKIPELCK